MSFTREEYDVLIAAAEVYPVGYGDEYAVDLENNRYAHSPVQLPALLAECPAACC